MCSDGRNTGDRWFSMAGTVPADSTAVGVLGDESFDDVDDHLLRPARHPRTRFKCRPNPAARHSTPAGLGRAKEFLQGYGGMGSGRDGVSPYI